MFSLAHWVFFIFMLVIIFTLILRKEPILPGAIGLLIVGLADQKNLPGAIEVAFRAIIYSTENLLTIILLIGMVVGMTKLLQDTGANQLLLRPLGKLRGKLLTFWVLGIVMWILTLFLWPTPAVTLLGAVIVPTLRQAGVTPLGIGMSLTIFGEGMGLAGDFIIQGAPSFMSKATGIPLPLIVNSSWVVVLGGGLVAALIASWRQRKFEGSTKIPNEKDEVSNKVSKEGKQITIIVIVIFLLTIITFMIWNLKGDTASAITGGVTLIILIVGTIIKDGKKSFSTFIDYLSHGFRFSMGVFVPVVIMAAFFFLGTSAGYEAIFQRQGLGYFGDYANSLSNLIPLNKWSVGILIVITSILGSMGGSGFSALPLTGGIAVAISQTAQISALPLVVLGQFVAIWSGALLIPWGFSAVTAAMVGIEIPVLIRNNLPGYIIGILIAFIITMFRI